MNHLKTFENIDFGDIDYEEIDNYDILRNYPKFFLFLAQKKIVNQFLYNFDNHNVIGDPSLEELFLRVDIDKVFSYAFSFKRTKEGQKYWNRIQNDFVHRMSSYQQSWGGRFTGMTDLKKEVWLKKWVH